MGARRPDFRKVKTHRTYSLRELATLLDLHPHTLHAWRKGGLAPIDNQRPLLFHGGTVRAFLRQRRSDRKKSCGPGHIFCLPCREPKTPAGGMLDYQPDTPTCGRLIGLCPSCGRLMFRRTALARVGQVAAGLDVQFPHAQRSLEEGPLPFVNCDSGNDGDKP